MTDHASTNFCERRWHALLAKHSILHGEYSDLLASFTPPFSARQIAQLEASAARRVELPMKLQKFIENGGDRYRSDAGGSGPCATTR
jgi:hypothetical protein